MRTPAREALLDAVTEIAERYAHLGRHERARRLVRHASVVRACEPLLADLLVQEARLVDPFAAHRAA